MRVMISLVGEQPAPNLLPIRHCEPDLVVLLETAVTERVGEKLASLIEDRSYQAHRQKIDGYRVPTAERQISDLIDEWLGPGHTLLFNVTGGTKPMALAAYRVAAARGGEVIYLGSESGKTVLYRYRVAKQEMELTQVETVEAVITLDEYLRAYQGEYTTSPPRDPFETAVVNALASAPNVDEVMTSLRFPAVPAVEVDFAVRVENQVGIGEVKKAAAKKGIDQLVAVTEQRALGTYVRRFLVSGREVHEHNRQLAAAHGITVVELRRYGGQGVLEESEVEELLQMVLARMRPGLNRA